MSEQTNDALLDELNAMPEKEKKKKKGKKKGGEEKPKEEPPKEEAPKEEPKAEEPKKEEEKKEEEDKKEGEEKKEEDEKKEENAPKKKKIVKKVVKKVKKGKGKENDALIKLLQEKKQKEKELEEQMIREEAERERKRKEEEEAERIRQEELERIEELKKKEENDKIMHFKMLGITTKEMKILQENKEKTEKQLQQQGTSLDEVLSSLKNIKGGYKKKKVPKGQKEKKEEDTNEKKEEIEKESEEQPSQKEEKPAENVETIKVEGEVDDEDNKKFVVDDNNDVDDWEDAVEENEPEENQEDENNDAENDKEKEEKEKEGKEKKEEKEKEDKPESTVEEKAVKTNKKQKAKKENIPKELKPSARLRAPIVCILGHVDTGKTKILDKLRRSNVQGGEAGGITQQIGATFLPLDNFKQHIQKINKKFQIETNIPGILLIDTPGHASFQNLRSRGSSLCDIAVLIINVMKGIEKQTIESLELLRQKKTPFIIALNQIDRIYQWKSTEWGAFRESYDQQRKPQQRQFNDLVKDNKTQLIKNNLNTELYDENPSMREYINLVPTSAITGEGMPDLLGLLVYISQKYYARKIEFKEEVQCTILEVKVLEGIGTTIDVILVNGTLHVGDKIIIGGMFGPIRTQIKIILTPQKMKEMRVKCEYDRHDEISGAIGVKLFCPELENALAGSPLYVYKTEEEAEKFGREITKDFNSIVTDFISKTGKGIMVQASTLGSLEAILTYLHDQKIQVSVVGVGNLNKKDVVKMQTTHAKQEDPLKEDLVILAFDNKVLPEAQQFADANGIKIFNDDVIYHLFDSYIEFKKQCELERKKSKEKEAIFPCMLKTVMFINKKDPLIIGVDVVEGILKLGTPLYCPEKELPIGVVEGMEKDHKPINNVRPIDGSVSIRLKVFDSSITAGRHFDEKCTFISQITRNSIDALKGYFKDDMTMDDWKTVIKLKKILKIN